MGNATSESTRNPWCSVLFHGCCWRAAAWQSLGAEAHVAGIHVTANFVGTRISTESPTDSDHNAIVFMLRDGERPLLRVLSWNVLCQYGYNEQFGYPYDGFCRRSESNEEYLDRISRTSIEVAKLAAYCCVDVVLLQECANAGEFGHDVLPKQLEQSLGPQGFTVVHEGEFLTAIRGDAAPTAVPLPKLRRQAGKIHAVHTVGLNTVLLNVHLLWDLRGSSEERSSRSDIEAVIGHVSTRFPAAHIILAGDTNRVPADSNLDPEAATVEQLLGCLGLLCQPPGPTNVRWSGEERGSELTYADFALWVPACNSLPA